MQKDMHYNATFCVAHAAGLSVESALQVATSCQFVDDNHGEHALTGDKVELRFKDGSAVYLTPTAHHPIRAGVGAVANVDEESQSSIWVPFHFLPGNEGNSFEERMLTTKDSQISRDVVQHALEKSDKPYALQLLGITMHCYSDTFSHYGFSGLKSDFNNVVTDSISVQYKLPETQQYVEEKAERFLQRFMNEAKDMKTRFISAAANHSHLGHGAALTHPDRPYMNWEFLYDIERKPCTTADNPKHSIRSNPATFLEGCRAFHSVFSQFLERQPSHRGHHIPVSFSGIEAKAREIIETEGRKSDRCDLWEAAFNKGHFGEANQPFPKYLGDDWNAEVVEADGSATGDDFLTSEVFKFYQAAEQHRAYILRDLLPSYGLVVK